MTNAEIIHVLVNLLEEFRKPCEDCQEFDCDYCKYKMMRENSHETYRR